MKWQQGERDAVTDLQFGAVRESCSLAAAEAHLDATQNSDFFFFF